MSPTPFDRDAGDLAAFGYRQSLDRTLGGFSTFAAGFSYLSVLTGSSQLFHLGFAAGGPAFIWTWPAVLAGQALVALCFAELAAVYPLSGGVYQWSRLVGSAQVGWLAGWVYFACSVVTLASVALALQTTLPQLFPGFQFVGRAEVRADVARNAVLLGCALVAVSTAINAGGVKVLARINNVGVFVEMAGALLLIVLLALAARQPAAVVFNTGGHGVGLGYLGPALAASLMATFVLYGFDTAGSLAEETDDPRRRAPWSILMALGSVGLAGSLLAFVAVRAARDLNDPELARGSGGLPYIVKDALGASLGAPFLLAMVVAIVVCTLTVHAAAVRLIFAMARDNQLPFASRLANVPEGSRTPTLPALVVGVAATVLLALNVNFPNVIEVMTSTAIVWANLAYLLVTAPMLWARIRRRGAAGGPLPTPRPGDFRLGRWGLAVNVAAVVWGVAIILNIGWPRPEVYGVGWIGRLGAAPATAAMLAMGLIYQHLLPRSTAGVLQEHRAAPPTPDSP